MNSFYEKEKKLNKALDKLKNLDFSNPDMQNNIESLRAQKNQLEIEKSELEDKYKLSLDEHANLSKKLEEIQNREKLEQKKQTEFSEKIDELNQETDTLLEEIDKWQM
jgi:chromosome segregation ATPase